MGGVEDGGYKPQQFEAKFDAGLPEEKSHGKEETATPLSLADIHQTTDKLRKQQLSSDEIHALTDRINATYDRATDPNLQNEVVLLEHRMHMTCLAKHNPKLITPEAIEQSVTELREQLEQPPSTDALSPLLEQARQVRKEHEVPSPSSESELKPPSEQARFINFMKERLQYGMVDFTPDGRPVEKHLHDAITLFYRPEVARKKGIAETPRANPSEETPPLNEDRQYYLDSLLERTIMAAGHTDRILPPEPSMHMVVRKLNRAMKEGTHYDPEFVWQMRRHRPAPRNPRPR